jgi:hypothetical protein
MNLSFLYSKKSRLKLNDTEKHRLMCCNSQETFLDTTVQSIINLTPGRRVENRLREEQYGFGDKSADVSLDKRVIIKMSRKTKCVQKDKM